MLSSLSNVQMQLIIMIIYLIIFIGLGYFLWLCVRALKKYLREK